MAREGYYIITDEQAEILDMLKIPYSVLGGKKCVQDWQYCIEQLDEFVWKDGDLTDEEGAWQDTMYEQVTYLYWSTEGHFWV